MDVRRRGWVVLGFACSVLIALALLLRWGPGRLDPPLQEPGREHQERQEDEPTQSTQPERVPGENLRPGTVVLSAPDISGTLPLVIVDGDGVRVQQLIPLNIPTDLLGVVPAGRSILLCPIGMSGTSALARLHAECEWIRPIELLADEWPRVVRFEFRKPSTLNRIRVGARTTMGTPIADMRFRIDLPSKFTTHSLPVAFLTTDSDGSVLSPALAEGEYRVFIQSSSASFRPLRTEAELVHVSKGEDVDVLFIFSTPASVRGILLCPDPSRKTVSIIRLGPAPPPFGRNVTTDAEGRFELGGIPPGRYVAQVGIEGYMQANSEFTIAEGVSIDVRLEPKKGGATIRGVLLSADGHPPCSNANMNTTLNANINTPLEYGKPGDGRAARVDRQSGRFEGMNNTAGPKLLILWDLGLLRKFHVREGEDIVELGPLRLPQPTEGGVSVHGRILVDGYKPGMTGAIVCLSKAGATGDEWIRFVKADGSSRFDFANVGPGRYLLWHEPMPNRNYTERMKPMEIIVGHADVELELRLRCP